MENRTLTAGSWTSDCSGTVAVMPAVAAKSERRLSSTTATAPTICVLRAVASARGDMAPAGRRRIQRNAATAEKNSEPAQSASASSGFRMAVAKVVRR
jgi:hypothetical protein